MPWMPVLPTITRIPNQAMVPPMMPMVPRSSTAATIPGLGMAGGATPWLIGGGVLVAVVAGYLYMRR